MLHVTHGPIAGGAARRSIGRLVRWAPGLRLIALSQAQWDAAPDLPFAAVCHNGIDLDRVPFGAQPGEYLAFVGRMAPEKGVAEAIEIARRAGRPLRIAAKCREPAERRCFERFLAPHIGDGVEWLGELGPREKFDLLRGAAALVFPISWPEPFGMVMIEAMACGTPVLATPYGSVPEVVRDGVTGVVRPGIDDLVAASEAPLDRIDREACRAHVAERFSADAMADAYERAMVAALHDRLPARTAGA